MASPAGLAAFLGMASNLRSMNQGANYIDVKMPGVTGVADEDYLCTVVPVGSSLFATGFVPDAAMNTAHHMILKKCKSPGIMPTEAEPNPVWICGHHGNGMAVGGLGDGDSNFPSAMQCGADGPGEIIYAWAMDAPKLDLPKGVGFEIGGDSDRGYLVIQVHYKKGPSSPDSSGVRVAVTRRELPKRAGVVVAASMESIPPMRTTYLDMVCRVDLPASSKIYPFAFRTHTHALGRVVSGYKVTKGQNGRERWSLIGKMDPQLPQAFYPVEDEGLVIRGGDYIAARCTMANDRETTTMIGATGADEMCNFYTMFYTREGEGAAQDDLWLNCEDRRWGEVFDSAPEDASDYEGRSYPEGRSGGRMFS